MPSGMEILNECLPLSFPFYHLGKIFLENSDSEPQITETPDTGTPTALGFTLRGDLQAALVLLIPEGLDVSMYSEAGNIIASRLVTRLAEHAGIDVVLSPPRRLQASQLQLLRASSTREMRKNYLHLIQDRRVVIETLLLVHSPSAATEARFVTQNEAQAGTEAQDISGSPICSA